MMSPKLQPIPRAILSCQAPFSEFLAYIQGQTKDSICQFKPEHYAHVLDILLCLAPLNAEVRPHVYQVLQNAFLMKEAEFIESAVRHNLVILDNWEGYKICTEFDASTCLLELDAAQLWHCTIEVIASECFSGYRNHEQDDSRRGIQGLLPYDQLSARLSTSNPARAGRGALQRYLRGVIRRG